MREIHTGQSWGYALRDAWEGVMKVSAMGIGRPAACRLLQAAAAKLPGAGAAKPSDNYTYKNKTLDASHDADARDALLSYATRLQVLVRLEQRAISARILAS